MSSPSEMIGRSFAKVSIVCVGDTIHVGRVMHARSFLRPFAVETVKLSKAQPFSWP